MRSTRHREGELVALAFNQKEQRLLEKSVATIRLETSYSLRLLQLSNRNIKVYFRQLRDKVSRLKSHLTADEIEQLRQLEAEGKLPTTHSSVNLGSALKIAATNRRLHPAHQRHPASALSRASHTQPPDTGSGPSQRRLLKRSNSVTGVFVDAPQRNTGYRPASAIVTVGIPTSDRYGLVNATWENKVSESTADISKDSNPSGSKPKEDSRAGRSYFRESKTSDRQQDLQTLSVPLDLQQTDSTDSESQQQLPTLTDSQQSQTPGSFTGVREREPLCETPTSKACSRSIHSRERSFTRTAFSSHAATEKAHGDTAVTTPRSRYSSFDKGSPFLGLLQDDANDDLDEKLYEERRAELLEEEKLRAVSITKRKDEFLKDLNQYLRDHPLPSVKPRRSGLTRRASQRSKETAAEEERDQTQALLRRRRVEFDLSPTYLPEENYREHLMNLWKDMSKCRYLRLSDDQLDLPGVNTLATDTLKLYKVLRQQDRKPRATAKDT